MLVHLQNTLVNTIQIWYTLVLFSLVDQKNTLLEVNSTFQNISNNIFLDFKFSLPLIASYAKPATTSSQDIAAAKRSMDFELDWNLAPLTTGDYSQAMKDDATIGSLFPVYTDDEKKMMKGTVDFIGVNYYSAKEVRFNSAATPGQFEDTGKPLGPVSSTPCNYKYHSIFFNFCNRANSVPSRTKTFPTIRC